MSTTWPDDNPQIAEGWQRGDGRKGLRNHVVAFSTVALADAVTRRAAAEMPEVLALTPQFERGLRGADAAVQARAIRDVVHHPNVGAILVVAHDRAAAEGLRAALSGAGRPVTVRALMDFAGVEDAAATMAADLRQLVAEAEAPRVPVRLGELTVALECGGSDASSAVCANPAIGRFVDRLIAAGGRAIVSETAEFLGGEEVVRRHSASPEIAEAILACLAREERLMAETGEDFRGVNPTRENIEAGLTTLTEKTMGAVSKIGRSDFAGCLAFGERPRASGLWFMDTPFFSPTSLSGMALGGAQAALFAMGVFNPSGQPLMPVLKICGNPQTLKRWAGSIDVDVSPLLTGDMGLDVAADRLAEALARVGAGALTCSERHGEGQLIVPRTIPAL
jgi:altronate dehydratase large subunit